MKTFELTYDATLQAVVRVTVKATTRGAAEFAAEKRLRGMRKLKLNFTSGDAIITKASIVSGMRPVNMDPCLLKIGDVDIDDACRECGADVFGSDGYDGRCGNCADRYENRRSN